MVVASGSGMIKFGSRVDVIFPADTEKKVRVGDHVKGGSSVLALASRARHCTDLQRSGGAMSEHAAAPQRPIRTARPRKGLYILPSLFTAGNIAAGYYAISQAIQGTVADPWHFDMPLRRSDSPSSSTSSMDASHA